MGGSPASSTQYMRIMEQLGFFTALGVVIVFVAGVALGRIASVASGIRPVEEVPETTVPVDRCPGRVVPADTVPVERVPASAGPRRPGPGWNPWRPGPRPGRPSAAGPAEETRPAQDTTGTVGSGTIQ